MFARLSPALRAVTKGLPAAFAAPEAVAACAAPFSARFLQHSSPVSNIYDVYDQNRSPTVEEAQRLPFEYHHLPHEVLLSAALNGSHDAKEELLVRNVMAVDEIEWSDASEVVETIKEDNLAHMGLASLPYKVGLVTFSLGGLASFPLCFHLPTVLWFNDAFVTFELAGEGELDTWLEVGSWAWNWMEPPLGQLSFFILTAQLCSSMMVVLGLAPYGDWMRDRRANRLCEIYPQYNQRVLADFARTQGIRNKN